MHACDRITKSDLDPALLVALTSSPQAVLWTVVAYLMIHQIEGNIVAPL
jgi:predicted PurR-regulated permease PerM